jgi:hypothetical protein
MVEEVRGLMSEGTTRALILQIDLSTIEERRWGS